MFNIHITCTGHTLLCLSNDILCCILLKLYFLARPGIKAAPTADDVVILQDPQYRRKQCNIDIEIAIKKYRWALYDVYIKISWKGNLFPVLS